MEIVSIHVSTKNPEVPISFLPESRKEYRTVAGKAYKTRLGGLSEKGISFRSISRSSLRQLASCFWQDTTVAIWERRLTSAPMRARRVEIMMEALYARWTQPQHIQGES